MKKLDFSLVIPCDNEQDNVASFFNETEKAFKNEGEGRVNDERTQEAL